MKRHLVALLPVFAASLAIAAPPAEPAVEQRVHEDDNVRIEELRVRGQTQRIVVRTKGSDARPYEIVPSDAGDQRRASAGQRVWQILSF